MYQRKVFKTVRMGPYSTSALEFLGLLIVWLISLGKNLYWSRSVY